MVHAREPGAQGDGPAPAAGARLFVALALPESVRNDLALLEEPLGGLSWTRAAQLHLTLRFLGEVPAPSVQGLEERLAAVRVEPFILPIEGVGSFPPKGDPQVIWAGTGSGHPHLFQLRQRIDDAALAAGVDFDVHLFHPHVTLARCPRGGGPAARSWLRRHAGYSGVPFRVTAFELCESRITRFGAEHSLRRRYSLAGAP